MLRKLIVLSGLIISMLTVTSTVQAKQQSSSNYVNNGLLCIHSYEGAWNDPNPPYWGGLQMDMNFQNAYGYMKVHKRTPRVRIIHFGDMWGTADHWPIWAQMIAGRHGYYARGWLPWRNTARLCGLI